MQLRLSALVALAALTTRPTSARANDLYVGSLDTQFAVANPPGSAFQPLGACVGLIQSMAAEGNELYLADTGGGIYRYRNDSQIIELWTLLGLGETRGLAVRGFELFAGTNLQTVVAFDRATRNVTRVWNTGIEVTALGAEGADVFASTPFGAVLRLMPDGTTQFLGSCGGPITAIAANSSELFVGSQGAIVWRIDRASGAVSGTIPVSADPTGVALVGTNLFVASADNRVRRYSSVSGALLGETVWSSSPSALAFAQAPVGDVYCFGDASFCPCSNGDPLAGCAHQNAFGARLTVWGSSSVAADDLAIAAFDLPSAVPAQFFMGNARTQVPFGNGLLCVASTTGSLYRYPVSNALLDGFSSSLRLGPGVVAQSQQSFPAAGAIQAGSTWNFQVRFRDIGGPCGARFNTTNAVGVTFTP